MFLRTGLTIAVGLSLAGHASAETRTLQEALAEAYSTNPSLQAARAQLRAMDENVPQALSGWRPQVSVSADAGYASGTVKTHVPGTAFDPVATNQYSDNNRGLNQQQVTLTQPLWLGGQTQATTHRAENQVMGQRARLIASEQQVFTDAINAFVSVIGNAQVLALNVNNEQVLTRQLQATNDRFRVGEITRTDVAQAEAALAGATAHPADLGRQPAERPLDVPAGGRRPARRAGRAAAPAAAGAVAGAGEEPGGGEQPDGDRRAVRRRRREGQFRPAVLEADAEPVACRAATPGWRTCRSKTR